MTPEMKDTLAAAKKLTVTFKGGGGAENKYAEVAERERLAHNRTGDGHRAPLRKRYR